MTDGAGKNRRRLRCGLAALYAFVGVVHLAATDRMLPLMPDWVPEPRLVIRATGLCEVAGALGLLTRSLRRAAAIGLALYAVCVYPANVKQALYGIHVEGLPDSWWYHGPRLAFQPVFVWAALYAGGLIDWPFRGRAPGAGDDGIPGSGDPGIPASGAPAIPSAITAAPGPAAPRTPS